MTHHQFSLFGYQRPSSKVPISAEQVREAKKQMAAGDNRKALNVLRDLNDRLENFERRLK